MTVIATASNPRFSVSRVDIDRGGKTYTVDTLRDIRKIYPDDELFFITGLMFCHRFFSGRIHKSCGSLLTLWELADQGMS